MNARTALEYYQHHRKEIDGYQREEEESENWQDVANRSAYRVSVILSSAM